MIIQFNIDYRTAFGESLVLNILEGDSLMTYQMLTSDGMRWSHTVAVKIPQKSCSYYYSVMRDGNVSKCEWTLLMHRLDISAVNAETYTVYDRWQSMPEDAYLYSSAFTDCINHQQPAAVPPSRFARTVRLQVRAPQLRDGEKLMLSGAGKALGEWNVAHAVRMTQHVYNEWTVDIDAASLDGGRMEFKFVATAGNVDGGAHWETCMNRTVRLPQMKDGDVVVYSLDQAFFRHSDRKLAGTQVPVFSLRSGRSAGVGDFGDLKTMIDYVEKTGQKVLQLLPVNDTTITNTWTDSYPYSCISIFALHPQYADLRALPELKDARERAEAEKTMAELNALPQIDYERVNGFKVEYMHKVFEQEGEKIIKSAEFKAFFRKQNSGSCHTDSIVS